MVATPRSGRPGSTEPPQNRVGDEVKPARKMSRSRLATALIAVNDHDELRRALTRKASIANLPCLPVRQAAEYLSVTERQVYRLIHERKLEGIGAARVSKRSVAAYLERKLEREYRPSVLFDLFEKDRRD